MATLNNVTIDDIYNKIMLILIANESKVYDQYKLYSLVLDKISRGETNYVPPEFKLKFFITVRTLMSKDDNITVIKKNNIYYIAYNALGNLKLDPVGFSPYWINESELNEFIINNNLDLSYQDPESGNTIYHNILSDNKTENITKLLEINNINYNIKNNNNKTPIECIKNIEVATIIINDLNKKINSFEDRLKLIENQTVSMYFDDRIKILENDSYLVIEFEDRLNAIENNLINCSIINFIKIKICNYINRNSKFILFIKILIILFVIMKIIQILLL
jgi:hypothetical protein